MPEPVNKKEAYSFILSADGDLFDVDFDRELEAELFL